MQQSATHQAPAQYQYQTPQPYITATPVRTAPNDELSVTVKSFKMTWGNMFSFQFKFWVVATVYSILAATVWAIVWAALIASMV